MIILGIDPGLATTGFALIEDDKKIIDYGCINTSPKDNPGDRLRKINRDLAKIIKKHNPKVMAVESLYFFKNLKTAMPVSQAKGVILFTASQNKLPVFEFTPMQVKMAVTGYGKADKKQVQKMIKNLLGTEDKPKDKDKRRDDAIDALGIALSFAYQCRRPDLIA